MVMGFIVLIKIKLLFVEKKAIIVSKANNKL